MKMNEDGSNVVDSELFKEACYQTGIAENTRDRDTCRNFYWNLIDILAKGKCFRIY